MSDDAQVVQQALKTVDQAVIKALNKMIESRNAEIDRLRAQQAILIDALRRIVDGSFDSYIVTVAAKALGDIGEAQ